MSTTYQATLFHDKGRASIRFTASTVKAAVTKLMLAENCPPNAIQSMVKLVRRGKMLEAIPVVKNGQIIHK